VDQGSAHASSKGSISLAGAKELAQEAANELQQGKSSGSGKKPSEKVHEVNAIKDAKDKGLLTEEQAKHATGNLFGAGGNGARPPRALPLAAELKSGPAARAFHPLDYRSGGSADRSGKTRLEAAVTGAPSARRTDGASSRSA
jgi:hypothetical protein